MFGLGMTELLVVFVVALLFLGPDKLPDAARKLSEGIRDFRRHGRDLQRTLDEDTELGSAVRDLKSALRGDDLPPRRATYAKPPASAPTATETGDDGAGAPVKRETGRSSDGGNAGPAAVAHPYYLAPEDRAPGVEPAATADSPPAPEAEDRSGTAGPLDPEESGGKTNG
jgi:sec-independent protein translocase protein TatB